MKEFIIEYHDYNEETHFINTTEDKLDYYFERLGHLVDSVKEVKEGWGDGNRNYKFKFYLY